MEVERNGSHYKFVCDQFITQLTSGLKTSLNFVERLFAPHAQITLAIYPTNTIDEVIGFSLFKQKLSVLGIHTMYFDQYQYTCQFLLQNYLVTVHGTAMINQQSYRFYNTIVFRKQDYKLIIDHFTLYLFL